MHDRVTARGELRGGRFDLPAGVSAVIFDRARMVDVSFSAMEFTDFMVHGSEFEGCDFSGTAFDRLSMGATCVRGPWDGRNWPQSVFRTCVFRRTRFARKVFFGNVRFEGCVFDRSRLREQVFTSSAEFVDCAFLGPVKNIDFWGRPAQHQAALGRSHNDFAGNDFTGAELDHIAFHDIDLRAQRWPGPPDYALVDRISERVAAVLPLVERWPDAHYREEARSSLKWLVLTARGRTGDQALVSPNDMGRKLPPPLRRELFEALRRTSSDTSPV
ncbi:pentapeptide repeat-containing protein [Actinoallomurus soli]|uniref:hypothetical protein n=1 Tax=Actinoallomurus soli TaxID=2952535 RepID=UPI0020930327|nr:hypothetical protein [Actinoallomurus soli]MCO5973066.1 hypothetical protein [Actinoallomurus soli]